jgi:asparagine synthase (glutamine-hydrolysing)
MCGIAGYVGSGPGRESLERMLDVQRHRGPDDRGALFDPPAHMGQVRLSIIDLDGGHQPIPNEDETLWIICNGEIYNHEALRVSLQERGHVFRTRSDTEVILHLYEEHGQRCVDHLRGMFAFAIWDRRRQRLFAARDHLGQKPFYYAAIGDQFYFSSEIKGLLAVRPDLREPNLEALDQYLALRFIAAPRSMFRRIRKLPPAHHLTFEVGGRTHVERYWQLAYEPKRQVNLDDAVAETKELLLETLRLHMVSDVPVGAFLSGGLDSGLVTAMLCKDVLDAPLKTFTLGLKHEEFDESAAAAAVSTKFGTEHYAKTVSPSIAEYLPDLVWHLDEPSDPLSLCAWLVAGLASRHVKVVVGGDGGDELFGGYDRYYGVQFADQYARIPRAVRDLLLAPLVAAGSGGSWYKSRMHQLKWLHRLASYDGGERYAAALNYFYFDPAARKALYGEQMVSGVGDFAGESFVASNYSRAKAKSVLDRMLATDLEGRLPDHPVMITDRMTMAHGLEARSPFMDHKLAEFCARLPAELKVKGRSLRVLQRRIATQYLPAEVLRRPKQGFASAMPYMLRNEYPALFRALLGDSWLVRDGFFRSDRIAKILDAHLAGKADHATRLWLLTNSEIWYRMAIQNESRESMRELLSLDAQIAVQ